MALQCRPHLPKEPLPKIEKLKQRTVSITEETLPVYISGVRVEPHPLLTLSTAAAESKKALDVAQIKNLLWVIARQVDPVTQIIPSWTGFNITVRASVNISQDIVGYMSSYRHVHSRRNLEAV